MANSISNITSPALMKFTPTVILNMNCYNLPKVANVIGMVMEDGLSFITCPIFDITY